MAQPVWISDAGSLGTIPEGVFFQVPLLAYDPDGGDLFYEVIAGKLPAGIQCEATGLIIGVPRAVISVQGVPLPVSEDVTSKFAARVYTKKIVNGVSVVDRISDRTFTLTVSGQDAPEFITPAGQIAQYYDGSLVSGLQIQYTDVDPGDVVVVKLIAGSLPQGLTINSKGLISGFIQPLAPIEVTAGYSNDGQGYSEYPFDFSTMSSSANYEFTLEVTDGKSSNIRTFSIYVWSQNSMTADNTFITADNTFITADVTPVRTPILLNPQGSIGTVRNDNFFAYKFNGLDLDGDQFEYEIVYDIGDSSGIPGLTLDPNSGWLYGYIPALGLTENTYNFYIRVYKKDNPSVISNDYAYSLTITGPVSTDITWLTPSNLGYIDNGATSILYVAAINAAGIPLQYQLESGSNSSLPQGLQLLPSGAIAGKVSFNTFALDQGTTTFDVTFNDLGTANIRTETTFDMKHTFTVNAFSVNGLVNVTKVFSITVVRKYNAPYDNLYIEAMPPLSDRELIASLLQNQDIFIPDLLYRPDDPNFGRSTNIVYQHAFGLTAATYADYVSSLYENHYWKNLTLGEIDVAQATDAAGVPIYDVVYSKVIDNLLNNQGQSVSKQVTLPYPINAGDSTEITTVYPNSLINMRDQVIDTVGQVGDILPLWMTSKQADSRVLGFTPACVLAYVKPGRGKQIAYYIATKFGEKLNLVDFEVDRYELDRLLSHNWDPMVPTMTFDPVFTGNHIVLSNQGLTVTAESGISGEPSSLATVAINPGEKVMFSVTIDVYPYGSGEYTSVGIANHMFDVEQWLGFDSNSLGFWNDGAVYNNSTSTSGYPTFEYSGAVVDVAVDRANNFIWMRVAGGDWNNDSLANPATATGGVDISSIPGIVYPGVNPYYYSGLAGKISINTTSRYTVPNGFKFIGQEQGAWEPTPAATTFDLNAHYQIPESDISTISFDGGINYAVGDQILVLGTQVGGTDTLNDIVLTVNTVDGSGTIVSAFCRGTAPMFSVGDTYSNIAGTNISGSGTDATWSFEVVGDNVTTFDGNSLKFISPSDMYTNTQEFDKYLVFPKRTILG